SRLGKGGFGHKVVLLLSAEVGLVVGALLSAGIAAPLIAVGFWAVPLFGFVMAGGGVLRARGQAIRATRAEELPHDHPPTRAVHNIARELSLPAMPKVGIYPADELNAFAAGKDAANSVVSFSRGLTERCSAPEILAIAAHEVAHIANNDMRRLQFA